jgi:hypothetical protein
MRSSFIARAVPIAFALASIFAVGIAATGAEAGVIGWTGELAIRVGTLDAIPVNGAGVATVNGSSAGAHLNSLVLPASAFATANLVVPQTDPSAFPIAGFQATASNGAGSFSGGALAGVMPILGVAKVCLFGSCPVASANLSVPLSVVGAGGVATVDGVVDVTVIGAPWTVGTAYAGTLSAMGFAHGPASGTSSTAQISGTVRLVTPIFISTNIAASAVIPAFGFLTLHFVPEPGTLLLLSGGIAALVGVGRRRRANA